MSKTIADGSLSRDRLFITEAPDVEVALSGGRKVNLRDQTLSLVGELEEAFDEVEEKRREVRQDAALTDGGKRSRLRELDRWLAKKIRVVAEDQPVDRLEERLEEMREQTIRSRVRTQPDDLDEEWRVDEGAREARREIREMEPHERTELLMQAAREDDRVLMRAFEDSPLPLIGDDELAMARETHARNRWPERVERMEALETGIRRLRGNANVAMSLLAERSGDPEFELKPFPTSDRGTAAQEAEAMLAEAQ